MHAMIDLETMAKSARAVVASIGAVAFDPWGADTLNARGRVFHMRLRMDKQPGREFDGDIVAWWLRQSERARSSLLIDQVPPHAALHGLASFYRENKVEVVWAYGASFDHSVLADLWDWATQEEEILDGAPGHFAIGEYPIHYRHRHCARTLCAAAGVQRPPSLGIEHSALDDALLQAEWLRQSIKALGIARRA